MPKAYKVLRPNRMPCNGGKGQWPKPGRWLEVEGELVACSNGLHLCRKKDIVRWLGRNIWEAEYKGEVIRGEDKIVVRKARLIRRFDTWNARTQRMFACDCAERVLPIFEKRYPDDDRPRKCIEVARKYAEGRATKKQLSAAASAAWAAEAAAWAARAAAAWAARAAAAWAAWAAAAWAERAAAAAMASDAADAACAEERRWQTKRLFEYLEGTRK